MANKKKNVKAVLVGCGSICGGWLLAIQGFKDIKMVGLVDLNLKNAKKRQKDFELNDAIVGTSLVDVIKKSGAEVVFDCTVPEAHVHVTTTALSMGCHVLGEKPMADTMQNARKMLRAAEKNDRIYAVIQNRRYMDNIITYRKMVQSGKIGDLTTLNADFYLGPHFGGFRDKMDHVLLLDMAIHSFDQARFISGMDPVSVYCHEWNPKGSWYKHGASAIAVFEMSNGTILTYRGSWCAQGLNTPWECEWRAVGSKGTATWDGSQEIRAQIVSKTKSLIWKEKDLKVSSVTPLKNVGHAGLIREFVDCVLKGKTPQTICTDNIKSLAMVHAAIESTTKGKKVKIKL